MSDKPSITRQEAINKIGSVAKKLAIASLPLAAVGTFAKAARAIPEETKLARKLNVLLQMEYVLKNFTLIGAENKNGLVPGQYAASLRRIYNHHVEHVERLKFYIINLGGLQAVTPRLQSNFNTDELNPKSNFDDFLMIAQVLEDAVTSLYKKYIPEIRDLDAKDKLQRAMLRTHSAEARHAAYFRLIRSERDAQNLTPWISSTTNNAVLPSMQEVYANEDNTLQTNIDVPAVTNTSFSTVKEAWDEPSEDEAINQLFQLFKVHYF